MEQVLYKLPDGWEWHSVKKLSHNIQYGHTAKAESNGNAKFLRITDIQDGKIDWQGVPTVSLEEKEISKYALNDDDLIFARSGATAGKSILIKNAPKDAVFASYLIRIVPNKKDIIPEYLSYFFLTPAYWEVVGQNAAGAAQPNINGTKLSEFIVPVAPQGEQKRIVEKLDALLTRIDTAIEHLQESATLADSLYASSLDQVFEKVYLDYSTKPLSVLASKIGSGATPKGGQKAYKESGISLIRSLNVYDSEFKPEGLAFIDDDQADKLSNVVVEEGDVLLNITGASIARCCVAPVELLPARVNQHVCIIRPNEELNSTYLNYLLISPKFKAALLFQGAGGATRQALTKVMVSNLEIPLPPLEMQAELVGKVNLFSQKNRALKEQVNSKISDLITLKASILDSAFKGEL
ncbi:TPA: restriction endonuclease subunit S [Vibrio cholerae]|uniref:Restriction endonuclease subunit S n=1 Tax=Proteus genomosp. 6 TaxID=1311820 RepID=A0ABV1LCA0_9GAMM|nr:restriction endonuclease subunit S [Vibrio cholerae]